MKDEIDREAPARLALEDVPGGQLRLTVYRGAERVAVLPMTPRRAARLAADLADAAARRLT